MSESGKPIKSIRHGMIQCAIWKNTNDNGTYYAVTFERSYKDGEEWKSTASFGRDDLLLLAKIADEAHSAILELQREERDRDDKGAKSKAAGDGRGSR